MSEIALALVDEQPIVLSALERLFSPLTVYTVVGAGRSSQEALIIAARARPQVMVIDLAEPVKTLEAISLLSSRCPSVKIIGFTACAGVETAVRMLEAGAKGFVSKLSTPDELITAVETVLRDEMYVSQCFAGSVATALRNAGVRKVAAQAMKLSVREDQIVRLLLQGKKNKEIASQLFISEKTVKHYMSVLMQKLNARSRVEVVLAAHEFSERQTRVN